MPHALPTWLFFIPSVFGLQIGTFVLLADWRSLLNRLVFLTSLAVSLWNLENVWEMASFPWAAISWFRLGGIFLPILSLHVLAAWRGRVERALSWFLALGYGWALAVVATGPRMMFVRGTSAPGGPFLPPYALTPGFLAFCVYFLAAIGCSALLLNQELRAASGRERAKLSLVAVASAAAISSAALGLFYHRGYPFHALNAVTTLVYLGALAWVVVRYRFGNPSLSLRTSAVYSLVLASVTGLYVAAVVFLATWLQAWQRWNPLVVAFFCVLIAGPLFHPFEQSLTTFVRRFVPLPRDLYYEGLKHFLQEINVLSPLPDLSGFIVSRLASLFELSSLCLLVQPTNSAPFLQTATLHSGWPQLMTLRVPPDHPKEWTLAHLRRSTGLPLVAVFPLAGRSRPVGVLAVSRHPDGSPLASEEREVMQALVHQAGVALENAELYAELVAVKNHYLTVIQSSASALLVVNPAGLVEDANRRAEALFGSPGSLVGQPVDRATGQPLLAALVAQVVSAKGPLVGREVSLPGSEGEAASYAVNVAPLLDAATGVCSGAVVVLSDLSPIRAMERQVERAERLAALGQLTAGLAHELRNGLNKITGYATMLTDELAPPDPRHRLPLGILEDTAQLETMLQRFLAFAREERLTRTEVSLRDVLDKVLDALRPELRTRRIHLVRDLPPTVPTVLGDPAQLAQALTNVVLNAVEAMEQAGGTLTVGVRQAPHALVLWVADTGPGIPPDKRELVFNPFFTTKPNGTGLGLSITHRIIAGHGGTVSLDSRPGRGTTVRLQLPLGAGKKDDERTEGGWV